MQVRRLKAGGKTHFRLEKTLVLSLAWMSQSCLLLRKVARGQSLFRKSRKPLSRNPREQFPGVSNWVQGLDLNQRPSGYEPDELPGCSTLQHREGETMLSSGAVSTNIFMFVKCIQAGGVNLPPVPGAREPGGEPARPA